MGGQALNCASCGAGAPSANRVAQGWVSFAGIAEMIIDVPNLLIGGAIVPFEVVDAIRDFEGLVRLESPGGGADVVSVRETTSSVDGLVCPECLDARLDWDDHDWRRFLMSRGDTEGGL